MLYGAYHQSRLAKREVGIRVIEEQQKAIRDIKLAEEKKRSVEGKDIVIFAICDNKLINLDLSLQKRNEPSMHSR